MHHIIAMQIKTTIRNVIFLIFEPQIQPEKCNKKQFRSVPEVGQDDIYRLEMNSI